jgi:hypothetical protein
MPTVDITASLKGFRTLRTLPDDLREIRVEHPIPEKEKDNIGKSTPASVLSVLTPETSLPPDQTAWVPVARQVLAGEFHGADRSTRESLITGLRGIGHPVCHRALERLKATKEAGR